MNKPILVIILIILLGTGAYIITKDDTMDTVPVVAPIVDTSAPVTPIENPTSAPTDTSATFKTYSNAAYGFSFQYPSTWKLTEDTANKSVTIKTGISAATGDGGDVIDYESITFKATTKAFFTPHVGTKYGEIAYDEKLGSLVDADSSPATCLKASPILHTDSSASGTVQGIKYAGSLMSDPAYGIEAILTKNGSIIIVGESYESGDDNNLMVAIKNNVAKIANSFTLLGGNTVVIPACAK